MEEEQAAEERAMGTATAPDLVWEQEQESAWAWESAVALVPYRRNGKALARCMATKTGHSMRKVHTENL